DFSHFGTEKSASQFRLNWIYAASTVGAWNVIIGTTFAIPVSAFKLAINHQPEYIGSSQWQWLYNIDGFTSKYTARLVGTLESSHIRWDMYITREGIEPFDELRWFEGTSALNGMSGQ